MLEFDEAIKSGAVIKVVGVGGGGGNAVASMINAGLTGVEFIVANTDVQALRDNPAPVRIQIGSTLTKGLGAGANPEVGRNAAMEDRDRIAEHLAGADMVFVTAGMGGGTGTGAAPVIAEVARELGALTVGVVTRPFRFEGNRRERQADEGIRVLHGNVDTLITIPNSKLVEVTCENTTLKDAFLRVDEVLLNAVRGTSDIINRAGLINVDFADVREIMANQGRALMGIGVGSGANRALDAAAAAIHSPLLEEVDVKGAMGVLINFTSGTDLRLSEVDHAASFIQGEADPGAQVIFGAVIDPDVGDELRITVIATGFDPVKEKRWSGSAAVRQPRESGVVPGTAAIPRSPTQPDLRTGTALAALEGSTPLPVSRGPRSAREVAPLQAVGEARENLDIPAFLRRQAD